MRTAKADLEHEAAERARADAQARIDKRIAALRPMLPVIVRMDDIGLHTMWDTRPNISRWLEGIRSEPAFSSTYYFGSLLTEKYPHLVARKAQQPH